ncbi:hypothetical protein T261_3774 [Streptomyces lydicus]|nr:hypothetical protein T261_3774 [Streptomyces lydicus]
MWTDCREPHLIKTGRLKGNSPVVAMIKRMSAAEFARTKESGEFTDRWPMISLSY